MTKADATAVAQRLRRTERLPTSLVFCDDCDAYHLVLSIETARRIDARAVEILQKASLGFFIPDIAREMGISDGTVRSVIASAKVLLGAQTLPHLVTLAASFGLIDPLSLAPPIKENCQDANA